MSDQWEGVFDPAAYEAARRVLALDKERASGEVGKTLSKRGRIMAVVAVVWAVCSVALAFANSELMLVAEIGWIAVVAVAVFFLLPAIMGRGNIDELFAQYEDRLKELEDAQVALPTPASMEDLVAALDLVKLPDGDGSPVQRVVSSTSDAVDTPAG